MQSVPAAIWVAMLLVIFVELGCSSSATTKSNPAKFPFGSPPNPNSTIRSATIPLGNNVSIEMRLIDPGTFQMGSPPSDPDAQDNEKPQVAVTISRPFWIGTTEVTQAQWEQVMQTRPLQGVRGFIRESPDCPVSIVTWHDMMKFCNTLTERERSAGRLLKEWEFSLPTEAQWEYACRAGTTTRFSFGDEANQIEKFAWYGMVDGGNASKEPYAHAVAQKTANAWGLFDMHGNVSEACRDAYVERLPGGIDPETKDASELRIARGGNFLVFTRGCRSAHRNRLSVKWKNPAFGFRVVCVETVR